MFIQAGPCRGLLQALTVKGSLTALLDTPTLAWAGPGPLPGEKLTKIVQLGNIMQNNDAHSTSLQRAWSWNLESGYIALTFHR